MRYDVNYRDSARRDLSKLDKVIAGRIIDKIDMLQDDLTGDVKRLKNFIPRYRLRVSDWRVLFDVESRQITIWRVRHRSEVYDR